MQAKPRGRKAAAVATCVALLAGVAGPARAKAPKPAKFRLTVSGTQTSSWSRDSLYVTDGDRQCGARTRRSGSEQVSFRTVRPLSVRVSPYRYGGLTVPRFSFSRGRRSQSFRLAATVDRAIGDTSVDTCTGAPLPPDTPYQCGRRTAGWLLTLASNYARAAAIWLGHDARGDGPDPFPDCVSSGPFGWPVLQDHDPRGTRTWAGSVPTGRFFSSRARRIVVRARHGGKSGDPSHPNDAVVTSWTLVFVRVQ